MKRLTSILLGLAVVFPLHSCAVHGTFGREDLLANPPRTRRFDDFTGPPGQSVKSYETTDGLAHGFHGRAWIEGDSMVFEEGSARKPGSRHRLAIASLSSVQAWEFDLGREIILGVVVVGVIIGGAYAIAIASMPPLIGW